MDVVGIIFTVLIVLILVFVALYFIGRHLQKKQNESQAMIDQNRQTVSAYIIDKKKMKLSESNLPKAALSEVPWYMKARKLPMVKVKVGPQIATMICDADAYKTIPLKKTVKIEVAGAYILSYSTAKKGQQIVEKPKKLSWRQRMQARLNNTNEKLKKKQAEDKKKNAASEKERLKERERLKAEKEKKKAARKKK